MKKLLLAMMVIAFSLSAAIAQPPAGQKDPKKDYSEWDKKVKDELKLTEEQVVKYDAISKETSEKINVLSQDATLSKELLKEKKMALKKEKETRLFEIFTAEQKEKYKELIEKKKKEMAQQPAGS